MKTTLNVDYIKLQIPNVKETTVTNYGNNFYGTNKDGAYTSTFGIRLYTEAKYSEHYISTGFVVKGYENSLNKTSGAIIYQDGKFIEITLFDGRLEWEANNPFRDLFLNLVKHYKIIDNKYVYIANTPIIQHTVTMERITNEL